MMTVMVMDLVQTVREEVASHVQVNTGPIAATELIAATGGKEDLHLCLVSNEKA